MRRKLERGEQSNDPTLERRICADLEQRGLTREVSLAMSRTLEARAAGLADEAYQLLLEGATTAVQVVAREGDAGEAIDDVDARPPELQEIERLMESFGDELSKLDEVLEVLAAHVRRMRTNSERTGEQTGREPVLTRPAVRTLH